MIGDQIRPASSACRCISARSCRRGSDRPAASPSRRSRAPAAACPGSGCRRTAAPRSASATAGATVVAGAAAGSAVSGGAGACASAACAGRAAASRWYSTNAMSCGCAVLRDREVLGGEAFDRLAVLVLHRDRLHDQPRRGAEGGAAAFAARGLWLLGRDDTRPQRSRNSRNTHMAAGPVELRTLTASCKVVIAILEPHPQARLHRPHLVRADSADRTAGCRAAC